MIRLLVSSLLVVIRVGVSGAGRNAAVVPPHEQVGCVAPRRRFVIRVPAVLVIPDSLAGVGRGVVPVWVGEIALPVLAVLAASGRAHLAPVPGAVLVSAVAVPDAGWDITVLPHCVRVVGVAPGLAFAVVGVPAVVGFLVEIVRVLVRVGRVPHLTGLPGDGVVAGAAVLVTRLRVAELVVYGCLGTHTSVVVQDKLQVPSFTSF